MTEQILKNKIVVLGIIVGAVGGYLYYFWIGCTGGSCAITSQPVPSTIYGALMGGLLFSMFRQNNDTAKGDEKK